MSREREMAFRGGEGGEDKAKFAGVAHRLLEETSLLAAAAGAKRRIIVIIIF